MATHGEWAKGYARQAGADFETFRTLQPLPVPECYKLQFLQRACEKLVKAHLCGEGTDPASLQSSHSYIARTLPIVLRQHLILSGVSARRAKATAQHAKHLCQEIEVRAPAAKRGGQRPDNCEYPWVNGGGVLHVPLDWQFYPSQLLVLPAGRTFLKLVREVIDRLL